MLLMFREDLIAELNEASCVKRNSASTCTYVHGQRERSSQVQKSSSSPKDVQSQVRHLEELVISLMNKTAKNTALSEKPQPPITPDASSVSNSSNATSPSHSTDQVANTTVDTEESFGRISIEDDQLNYVGSSHWTTILDNVSTFLHSRSHCRQDASANFNRSRS
jgi:hypothetical protein